MKRLLLLASLILGTAALAIAPVAASSEKWWDAYNQGVASVKSKNYDAAVQALQRALAEMPNENAAARPRNDVIIYVPHYWLGIARFNLGDIDAALREWKQSEDQGVIQNTRLYAELREWVARAQSEKQRSSETAAVDGKREANAAVDRAVSAKAAAMVAGGDDRSEMYRAAQRKLQEALFVVNHAGTQIREYRRGAEIAAQARDLFSRSEEEAHKQRVTRPALAQKAPASTPAQAKPTPAQMLAEEVKPKTLEPVVVAQAPPPVRPSEQQQPPAAHSDAVSSDTTTPMAEAKAAMAEYGRHLAEATTAYKHDTQFRDYARQASRDNERMQADLSGKTDVQTIHRIASAVSKKERELSLRVARISSVPTNSMLTVTPPQENVRPALESAYRALAVGDLQRSEEMLTQILSAQASDKAYLLRGCGRYTQAILSRQPDPLLAAATADFRAALKLNRGLHLDPAAFSPKLVAFFDQVKKGQ